MKLQCFLLALIIFQWTNYTKGSAISTKFLHDLMQKYSKKYVVWYLPDVYQATQLKGNLIDFGRNFASMMVDNQAYTSQQHDINLFLANDQTINAFKDTFSRRQVHGQSLWIVDISQLQEPLENTLSKLDTLDAGFNDAILLFKASNQSYVQFWEVYKVSANTPMRIGNTGNWSEASGIVLASEQNRNQRLKDLQGLHLKIASKVSKPYINNMVPKNGIGYQLDGLFADVFFNLQALLNFTYTVEKPLDGEWGSRLSNDSWTGMVGMLIRKEIDVAVTDFTITMERSPYMTFSEPIQTYYHTLFIKNPSETFNYLAYVEPMSYLSWTCLASFCLLVPPLLCLITSLGIKDDNFKEFSFVKCYIFVLSAVTMKGWNVKPTKNSGQLAFLCILFFGILMYYHWEAMLISYLSTRFIVMPFNTIPELITSTDFKITAFSGSSMMDSFIQSNDFYWQQAWKTRIQPNIKDEFKDFSADDFVQYIIENDDVAYYDNYLGIRTFEAYEKCQIKAIKAKYDVKPLAFGFQKDSPFAGLFNYHLKEMRETGALDQIMKKYESGPQVCEDYSGKPLGVGSVSAAFAIIILAMLLVLVIFGLEFAISLLDFDGLPRKIRKVVFK